MNFNGDFYGYQDEIEVEFLGVMISFENFHKYLGKYG